ncbi:MAG: hypothetical protein HYT67_02450 [Candidatus Yanofskybacteria bacterium]|nr:hypothetical protein [Candidatus Yanofskybacteria bacterium]
MKFENPTQNQEKTREQIVSEAETNLSNLITWIDVLKNSPDDPRNQETVDELIKKVEANLRELR